MNMEPLPKAFRLENKISRNTAVLSNSNNNNSNNNSNNNNNKLSYFQKINTSSSRLNGDTMMNSSSNNKTQVLPNQSIHASTNLKKDTIKHVGLSIVDIKNHQLELSKMISNSSSIPKPLSGKDSKNNKDGKKIDDKKVDDTLEKNNKIEINNNRDTIIISSSRSDIKISNNDSKDSSDHAINLLKSARKSVVPIEKNKIELMNFFQQQANSWQKEHSRIKIVNTEEKDNKPKTIKSDKLIDPSINILKLTEDNLNNIESKNIIQSPSVVSYSKTETKSKTPTTISVNTTIKSPILFKSTNLINAQKINVNDETTSIKDNSIITNATSTLSTTTNSIRNISYSVLNDPVNKSNLKSPKISDNTSIEKPKVERPVSPSYFASISKPKQKEFTPIHSKEILKSPDVKSIETKNTADASLKATVSDKLLKVKKLLDAFLLEVPSNQQRSSFMCLDTLLSNLLKKPAQDIYRSLRKRNPVLYSKVTKYVGALKVLEFFGFQEMDPTNTNIEEDNDIYFTDSKQPEVSQQRKLSKKEAREEEEKCHLILKAEVEESPWFYELVVQTNKLIKDDFISKMLTEELPSTREEEQERYSEQTKVQRSHIKKLKEECNPIEFSEAINALLQLLNNLMVEPAQAKFRKINIKNSLFYEKIGRFGASKDFLISLGFKEAGGHFFLLPAFENNIIYPRLQVFLSDMSKSSFADAQDFADKEEEMKLIKEFHDKLKINAGTAPNMDRDVKVFPSSVLIKASLLSAVPTRTNEEDDDKLQAGDVELIMKGQDGFKGKQEKVKQNTIERIMQRTGVDLTKAPGESTKTKPSIVIKKPKYEQTILRILFPEKLVLQALFHPYETISTVFGFVKNCLVDSNVDFYFLLPPSQRLYASNDSLASLQLMPAATLTLKETSKENNVYMLPSIVAKQVNSI